MKFLSPWLACSILFGGNQMSAQQPADNGSKTISADTTVVTPDPTAEESASVEELDATVEDPRSLLTFGPFDLRPAASYKFVYNDNINLSETNAIADYIHSISPSLFVGLGGYSQTNSRGIYLTGTGYASLRYTPTFIFFTENDENNTIDHRAVIMGGKVFERLSLFGNHVFEVTSEPVVDTIGRLQRQINSTILGLNYILTGSTTWDSHIQQVLSDFESRVDTADWSAINWLNYIYSPKLDFGLGVVGGYSDVDGFPNSYYEQGQLRIRYRPTRKLSVHLNGGMEARQFQGNNAAEDLYRPIFGAQIRYEPTRATQFALGARKEVRPSNVFGDLVADQTTVEISFQQRFLQRIYFNLNVGYSTANYEPAVVGANSDTGYDHFNIRPNITYAMRKNWKFSVFHTYQQGKGSGFVADFENNQLGVQVDYVW
jgi:hypothetical protein